MFLHNYWYAAAWSTEVGRTPFARTICNEPVVLYRTQAGSVVAMEDRCCHRRLPLRMGTIVGDNLQCHYHGLTFEPGGRCVKVPGQALVPPNARVRTYSVKERYGLVWLFLGSAEFADEGAIPDYHWITDPGWGAKGAYFHVKAHYQLIVENLLDLTHLAFVHATTIGNSAVVESADVQFKRGPLSVDVRRSMKNCAPPPTYVRAGGFTGNIDRWQFINFAPPGFVRLETGGCDAGREGDPSARKITLRNLNIVTPETDTSTHYFWAQCHDFDVSNSKLTEMIFEDVQQAFLQDVTVFEAQQQCIELRPEAPEIDVNGDVGGLQARRIVRELLDLQAGRARPIS
jgi:phenylpropionate dioxygenase-like ring-hydroxylating dioxygenase large terminal subunit